MISASVLSLGLLLPFVSATVYDIQVGPGLTFTPEAIGAQVGDQVVFHFHAKNHTVTQSSFADPCGPKEGGFDSGFMPVPVNQTDNFPTWTITVNDTNPIWAYCKQAAKLPAAHCGQGMVFSVNCGPDGSANSFTGFKESALKVGASLSAAAAAAPSTSAPVVVASTATLDAAYGTATIAPYPEPSVVTQTVTVESSTWTTTYSSWANSPAATPASLQGVIHKVIVGGANLTFDPPHVVAQPRDIIQFEFHAKNHSVTQSSFADPCRKLAKDGVTALDSGLQFVDVNATTFPTWSVTVNETAPLWFYCKQQTPKSHCGAGMVFAVNTDETSGSARSFNAFQGVAQQFNVNATIASSTTTGSAPATSSTDAGKGNGAVSMRVGFTAVVLAAASVVSFLL